MTLHSIDPQRRWRLRALIALTVGAIAALAFVVAPAIAAGTPTDPPSRLADHLAACEDMAAVAQTHDEKAFAEHCITLATRAIASLPAPSVAPTTSAPSPTVTPTLNPTPTQTASPTPSATSSATPTPSPTSTLPPASGWPNAATTGPTGTLTVRNEDLNITTAGAVVENLDVRGCVTITAPNVVFRNSKVTCDNWRGVDARTLGGVVIQDVEIDCVNSPGKGIVAEGATIVRADIYGCEDAVYVDRNVTVLDSYMHDLYGGGTDPHTDIVQVANGGDNVILRGNYMSNLTPRATSGYMGDGPTMDNIVIDRNYIEAGGYVFYCSSSGVGNVISGNTVKSTGYGVYGPNCTRNGIVRTGNAIL